MPVSVNRDEDSSKEGDNFSDKLYTQINNYRPVNAKGSPLIKSKRPATAKRPHLTVRKDKKSLTRDFSLLTKLKPRSIRIDKERLYEENLALKLRNNQLSEELIKLRTRITLAEKELNRKDEQNDQFQVLKPAHLINRLKLSIRDLKVEILEKDEEVLKVKRQIKITKLTETEVEIQAYIDECTRLRRNLEEIMRQKESPQRSTVDDKTIQQGLLLGNLKSENENLNQALKQCNEEVNKWRDRVIELEKSKKSSSTKKNESFHLKTELQKIKLQLDQANEKIGSKEGNYKDEMQRVKTQLDLTQKEIASRDKLYKDEVQKLKQKLEQAKLQGTSKDFSYINELETANSQLEQANKDLVSRENHYRDEIQKINAQLEQAYEEMSTRDTTHNNEISELKHHIINLKVEFEIKIHDLQKLIEDYRNKLKNFEEVKFPSQKSKLKSPPKMFRIINKIIESQSFALGSLISSLDKNHNHIISLENLQSDLYKYNSNMKTKYILEILGMLKFNKNKEISLEKLELLYEEFSFTVNDAISISDDEPEYQELLKESVEADLSMSYRENNEKKREGDRGGKKAQEDKGNQRVTASEQEMKIIMDQYNSEENISQLHEKKEIVRKTLDEKVKNEIRAKQEDLKEEIFIPGEKANKEEEEEEEMRVRIDQAAKQEEIRKKIEKLREEESVKKEEIYQERIRKEEKIKEEEKLKQVEKQKKEEQLRQEESIRQEQILKSEESIKQEEKLKEEIVKQEQEIQHEERLKQEERKKQEEKLKQEAQIRAKDQINEEERLKNIKKLKDEESVKQKEILKQEPKSIQEKQTKTISEEKKTEDSTETKQILDSRKFSNSKTEKNSSPQPETNPLSQISPSLKNILSHFSFRMQINRIPKLKLSLTLFGNASPDKPITKPDLTIYLKRSPFSFTSEEIDELIQFLLDFSHPSVKLIEEKLIKTTEDWEVFTPADEEDFDIQLRTIVGKSKVILSQSCKPFDKDNAGLIALDDLKTVLQELAIEFPPRVFNYMRVLFYSHNLKLNQVPYRDFIKAYGDSSNSEHDYPEDEETAHRKDSSLEEENAKIVRHYLGIMAKVLLQNKRNVAEVFESDDNGLISAEQFVVGLRKLGMRDVEHEHVMIMLEALQFEDTNEIYVSLDELKEILVHYGVTYKGEGKGEEEEEVVYEKSVGDNSRISDSDEDDVDSSDKKENSEEEHHSGHKELGNDYDDNFQKV